MLIGSVGQKSRENTAGMFFLCSVMSGVSAGVIVQVGLEYPLPGFFSLMLEFWTWRT